MIIHEAHIDKAIAYFETSPETFVAEVEKYLSAFPNVMQYIYSDNFEVLDQNEKELFEYLAYILIKSSQLASDPPLEDPDPEEIVGIEEKHWSLIQDAKGDFREKLTPFFDQYAEEDALAFIEDSLVEDDDFALVKEVKELFFVGLSTVVFSILG